MSEQSVAVETVNAEPAEVSTNDLAVEAVEFLAQAEAQDAGPEEGTAQTEPETPEVPEQAQDASGTEEGSTPDPKEAGDAEAGKPKKLSGAQRQKYKLEAAFRERDQFRQESQTLSQKLEALELQLAEQRLDSEYWQRQANDILDTAQQNGVEFDPVKAENEALKEQMRRLEQEQQFRAEQAQREQQRAVETQHQNMVHWISDNATSVAEKYGVDRTEVIGLAKLDYIKGGQKNEAIDWNAIGARIAGYRNLQGQASQRKQMQANASAPRVTKPGSGTPPKFPDTIDGAEAFLKAEGFLE